MHGGGDSQSDVEEFDRLAKEKWTDVVPLYEKGFFTEAFTMSYNATKE